MSIIKEQLEYTLDRFELDKEIGEYYRGKVRDNYYFGFIFGLICQGLILFIKYLKKRIMKLCLTDILFNSLKFSFTKGTNA